ncbi:MAG: hypothetical protein DHS20C15_25340 [Planctomycetota bacterium]|nr:MAG: hypothetical protein DHS20C15_25340 [Planctomycetota bacterium]
MRLLPPRSGLLALACGGLLMTAPHAAAQDDGFNFHVLSNFGESIYVGGGAGSGSVPGVDASGYWMGGEDMQGATMTNLGQFGYKQAGMRLTACVLNLGANSRLDFPAILTTEHSDTSTSDGFNYHHPYTFLRPGCGAGTANPGVAPITTAAFGAPTGAPPGSSFQWILFAPPAGVATTAAHLVPNAGLIPSGANTGTVVLITAVSVTAAISATGCYNFDLNWTGTLGSAIPALDNIEGWWTNLTASRDNNQYWTFASDSLNVVNGMGGFTSGGGTGVFTGLATSDIEFHSFSLDPATNAALAPASYTADNSYYAAGAPGPTGNAGYDLGVHKAISNSALNGARVIFSGTDPTGGTVVFPAGVANAQDVGNAALNIGPTPNGGAVTNSLGFVTWNNNTYATAGSNSDRLTWVQADVDMLGGGSIDPSSQTSVTLYFGTVRVPVRVPALGGGWPSSLTTSFWPLYLHSTTDQTGNSLFPDPSGNASGSLGVAPIAGSTIHVPIFGATGACAFGGLPVGLAYGTTGLAGPASGPLVWDPTQNRVSFGRSILTYE